MTVIFQTVTGSPVLAGDMLLSIEGPTGRTNLRLPSHPSGVSIPTAWPARYIPIRMRRKIFVLNDRLAVGVAGSLRHICAFLDDLASEFGDSDEFEYLELTDFLCRYGRSVEGSATRESIGCLILANATDRQGSLIFGSSAHLEKDSRMFGKVLAIGTGAASIIEQVGKLDRDYEYGLSQPLNDASAFPEFRTLAANLTLLANVYWAEFGSPNQVFDAWGGAYDLIYQDSAKVFRHLDDYTIFLRVFDAEREDEGLQLMNVLKYERRSNVSIVAMLVNGKLDFFGAMDITAPDRPRQFEVGGDGFTMNSKTHISIIMVGKRDKYFAPLIQIDGLNPTEERKQTVFTWFDDDGRLFVAFHADHDRWLKDEAASLYRRNERLFD